jgi:rhodanese-related sulfurtransferase
MTTIDDLLDEARASLQRLDPRRAAEAVDRGDALLVDIRSDEQRASDGTVPGTLRVARNVLEWRTEPLRDDGRRVVLMCDGGYQSSLAAATLQRLGLSDATDLDGGFQAWRAAGLPVDPPAR